MRQGTVRSRLGANSVIFIVFVVLAICLTVGVAVLMGAGLFDPSKKGSGGSETTAELVENPYTRVKRNAQFFEILNLEFYLPFEFKNVINNKKGIYEIPLHDDTGKGEVVVYVEKTNMKAEDYIKKLDNNLKITNYSHTVSGTSWVQADNATTLALATNFGSEIYAIVFSVEMSSKATESAMEMIPKTVYMKQLYK